MVSKILCVSTIFMVLFALTCGEEYKQYQNEEGCIRVSGSCMPSDECPTAIESTYKGLCPEANKENPSVQCCHGISLKETRCQQLTGECMPSCPEKLMMPRAKDCPDKTVCCVLI